jgi:hypothetical protein
MGTPEAGAAMKRDGMTTTRLVHARGWWLMGVLFYFFLPLLSLLSLLSLLFLGWVYMVFITLYLGEVSRASV